MEHFFVAEPFLETEDLTIEMIVGDTPKDIRLLDIANLRFIVEAEDRHTQSLAH